MIMVAFFFFFFFEQFSWESFQIVDPKLTFQTMFIKSNLHDHEFQNNIYILLTKDFTFIHQLNPQNHFLSCYQVSFQPLSQFQDNRTHQKISITVQQKRQQKSLIIRVEKLSKTVCQYSKNKYIHSVRILKFKIEIHVKDDILKYTPQVQPYILKILIITILLIQYQLQYSLSTHDNQAKLPKKIGNSVSVNFDTMV
eukprot:TRINITY_DN87469_c0_g1_i1.p1 TRINITY_DN87469_c0_g1~~TRINITY_DN87469_c0_g1_i1.p1  ORF type:complete len:197 (-),score=-20.95 TRINITY_DN87469_c0_g1_i1:93-683(-)